MLLEIIYLQNLMQHNLYHLVVLHCQIKQYLQLLSYDLEVVIVQTAVVPSVEIVAELIVDAKGVMSYNCPSKYNNKNLSVPIATYLFPFKSTKA